MPKRDPRSTSPPPALIKSGTFLEPRPNGALPYTIRFRAQLDGSRESQMNERTREWITDYVTGRPLPLQPSGLPAGAPPALGPPAQLPPVGEGENRKAIVITTDLCMAIAGLMMMEYPEEGDEPYSFEDWAVMSVTSPTAFALSCQFALDLAAESKEAEKNWPGPVTA